MALHDLLNKDLAVRCEAMGWDADRATHLSPDWLVNCGSIAVSRNASGPQQPIVFTRVNVPETINRPHQASLDAERMTRNPNFLPDWMRTGVLLDIAGDSGLTVMWANGQVQSDRPEAFFGPQDNPDGRLLGGSTIAIKTRHTIEVARLLG